MEMKHTDALPNNFKLIFNKYCMTVILSYSGTSDFYLWCPSLWLKSAGLQVSYAIQVCM